MTTIFTHAIVGATLLRCLPEKHRTTRHYAIVMGLAILPDIDTIAFLLHIPYASLFGHRGLSHALLVALLTGACAAWLALKPQPSLKHYLPIAGVFSLSMASHGVLDAMTNGGLGVAFFAPFDQTRYFFPWHAIKVSPIGTHFFSWRGMQVFLNECYWVCLPCFLIWMGLILCGKTTSIQNK